MRINPEDPRLTAYIMDELEPAERAELEQLLADCPESRAYVEELRAAAQLLEQELSAEPGPELSVAQRQAVEDRLAKAEEAHPAQPQAPVLTLEPAKTRRRRRWTGPVIGLSAAAAGLVLVAVTGSLFLMASRDATNALSGDKLVVADRFASLEVPVPATTPTPVHLKADENQPASHDPTDDEGRIAEPGSRTGEAYQKIVENPFRLVQQHPLSTFSIDVDTASYANMRRFLRQNQLPPRNSVRIEELINYFSYDYPRPAGRHPFSVSVDQASCPWNDLHRLVRVGLKGKELHRKQRPPSNLVFLIDVSGSMGDDSKLPLLRRAMRLLVQELDEADRVALVVYAGASGLVLPSTACSAQNRPRILSALERLNAGGSTNGGAGIQLAYNVAVSRYIQGGSNRVILATDGDFNVGTTSQEALVRLIQNKAKSKVFLSVLGFGMGNYKDATLEQLANKGNGNYAYIDTLSEARKVLVEQMSGTLVTIAKDVKIQVEFNPTRVEAYRLIGYENRLLAARDFADDKKDAGEIGAGHTVTALYEVVPAAKPIPRALARLYKIEIDRLKYQRPLPPSAAASKELLTIKLRYKQPEGDRSQLLSAPVRDRWTSIDDASRDFRFAAAVAWFGMVLRDSRYKGDHIAPLFASHRLARAGWGTDRFGYRSEFLQLVWRARELKGERVTAREIAAFEKAKELLKKAEQAFIAGNHRRSIKLARQVLKLKPDHYKALQILGASACYERQTATAKRVYQRLKPDSRALLKKICARTGTQL